jgi:hypothetical protein
LKSPIKYARRALEAHSRYVIVLSGATVKPKRS